MNREQLAWAAGFIDGEGHIGTHECQKARPTDQRNYAAISITVAQCNKEPLERLQKTLELGKIWGPYKKKNKNHTDFYVFSVTGLEKTQAALTRVWEWLGEVKQKQALGALEAYHKFNERPKLRLGPKPRATECHPGRKHAAHGLCESCYQMSYKRKKNEK